MELKRDDLVIGDWLVQPSRLRIVRGSVIRTIDPKPMAVLLALADAKGQVATREELFELVWGDAVVVDSALTRCVSELRKAFDDTNRDEVIETVRGIGYRLVPTPASAPSRISRISRSAPSPWTANANRNRLATLAALALILVTLASITARLLPHGEPAGETISTKPVTFLPGLETNAKISPDGKWVAYTWPGESESRAIYVESTNGELSGTSRAEVVGPTRGINGLTWSPDGDRIGFVVKGEGACEIRIARIADKVTDPVGDCGDNYFGDLEWSPGGKWLAYSDRTSSGSFGIVAVSVDGAERKALTRPAGTKYGDQYPVFSDDGNRLAFVRTKYEDAADVFVANADGSDEQRLTADYRTITGLDWWGRELIFSSKKGGPSQLWRVATDGGERNPPRWFPLGSARAHSPSVDAQGRHMVFQSDLGIVNVKSWSSGSAGSVTPLIESPHFDSGPTFSPDERWVAFVSDRSGAREIWVAAADGSNPRQLSAMGGAFVDSPIWSADGESIAFSASVDANSDIYVIDTKTGVAERVTTDPADEFLPRFVPGTSAIAFASDRSGDWQIMSVDLATRSLKNLTVDGGFAIRFDALHQRTLVSGAHVGGIRQLNSDGTLGEHVVDDLHELDWGAWDIVDDGVVYASREFEYAVLLKREWSKREPEVLATITGHSPWSIPWASSSLDASADGSVVLFGFSDVAESEVVLVSVN